MGPGVPGWLPAHYPEPDRAWLSPGASHSHSRDGTELQLVRAGAKEPHWRTLLPILGRGCGCLRLPALAQSVENKNLSSILVALKFARKK